MTGQSWVLLIVVTMNTDIEGVKHVTFQGQQNRYRQAGQQRRRYHDECNKNIPASKGHKNTRKTSKEMLEVETAC